MNADPALDKLPARVRKALLSALAEWLDSSLLPLEPLRRLDVASAEPSAGTALRALLIRLVESGGMIERDGSGIDELGKLQRGALHRLGIRVGALDIFVPAMLKARARSAWRELAWIEGRQLPAAVAGMPPVLGGETGSPQPGYRRLGQQWLRIDMAERLLREVHAVRVSAGRAPFALDTALPTSMGLTTASYALLLRVAGFQPIMPKPLREGAFGPPAPLAWRWYPQRRLPESPAPPLAEGAFAALAELVR